MKNALILHGTDANSKSHWFSWLKGELEKNGYEVWLPDLPGADKPNIEKYNQFILGNKDFEFNSETIIIGHSSGAVAILGLLEALPEDIQVDTCYLIASFKDDLGWDVLKGLFVKPFDFDVIKRKAKKFVFFHSDDDPYCPLEHAEYLSSKVSGELVVINGQGHFNLEKSPKYTKFPELLEKILSS